MGAERTLLDLSPRVPEGELADGGRERRKARPGRGWPCAVGPRFSVRAAQGRPARSTTKSAPFSFRVGAGRIELPARRLKVTFRASNPVQR